MIKIKLRLYNLSFINYAGCQDCRILNEVKQQLKEVLENLNYTVSKIKDKVSSIQTGDLGCSTLLDNKFNPLISKLEEWAARVDQTDYGRVKVHFKAKRV